MYYECKELTPNESQMKQSLCRNPQGNLGDKQRVQLHRCKTLTRSDNQLTETGSINTTSNGGTNELIN